MIMAVVFLVLAWLLMKDKESVQISLTSGGSKLIIQGKGEQKEQSKPSVAKAVPEEINRKYEKFTNVSTSGAQSPAVSTGQNSEVDIRYNNNNEGTRQ